MAYTDSTGAGSGEPALAGFNVVPDDNNDLPFLPRAFYVGVSGNLAVLMLDGTVLTFVGVVAGTILPVRAKRVRSTGTTATNILGLY